MEGAAEWSPTLKRPEPGPASIILLEPWVWSKTASYKFNYGLATVAVWSIFCSTQHFLSVGGSTAPGYECKLPTTSPQPNRKPTMPIILRRHCIFCLSSTALHGPCRNCHVLEEDALRELVDAFLIIEDEDEDIFS